MTLFYKKCVDKGTHYDISATFTDVIPNDDKVKTIICWIQNVRQLDKTSEITLDITNIKIYHYVTYLPSIVKEMLILGNYPISKINIIAKAVFGVRQLMNSVVSLFQDEQVKFNIIFQ